MKHELNGVGVGVGWGGVGFIGMAKVREKGWGLLTMPWGCFIYSSSVGDAL